MGYLRNMHLFFLSWTSLHIRVYFLKMYLYINRSSTTKTTHLLEKHQDFNFFKAIQRIWTFKTNWSRKYHMVWNGCQVVFQLVHSKWQLSLLSSDREKCFPQLRIPFRPLTRQRSEVQISQLLLLSEKALLLFHSSH